MKKFIYPITAILMSTCLYACNGPSQGQNSNQAVNINLGDKTGSNQNQKPIIHQFNSTPTQVVKKDDIITFKVVASDADNDVLKYIWSSTKGTLTSTQGEIVSWMPQKSDGSIETGTAVISVMVSDNKGGTDTSSVNIMIDQSGSAKVQ